MAAVNHLKDTFKISDNISHGLHGIYFICKKPLADGGRAAELMLNVWVYCQP